MKLLNSKYAIIYIALALGILQQQIYGIVKSGKNLLLPTLHKTLQTTSNFYLIKDLFPKTGNSLSKTINYSLYTKDTHKEAAYLLFSVFNKTINLYNLRTDKDYRKLGCATTLIEEIINDGRKNNIKCLRLDVNAYEELIEQNRKKRQQGLIKYYGEFGFTLVKNSKNNMVKIL